MSERANDQLADLIGSECNGHMQAGIASVTPDLRHIRLFPDDWPLLIFCFPPPAPYTLFCWNFDLLLDMCATLTDAPELCYSYPYLFLT